MSSNIYELYGRQAEELQKSKESFDALADIVGRLKVGTLTLSQIEMIPGGVRIHDQPQVPDGPPADADVGQ